MAQTERMGGLEKLWTCLRAAASAKAGRNLWKLNHCAVSSLNHISLLPWRVTLNLNERILKLWKSTRPFRIKVDKSNFFTASPSRVRLDRGGLPSETLNSGSLERGQPAGSAIGTILRVSTP
jgi:hypothetical protein